MLDEQTMEKQDNVQHNQWGFSISTDFNSLTRGIIPDSSTGNASHAKNQTSASDAGHV